MSDRAREMLQFIEENDIKFIRLAFCDIFGVQKNIAIMASQLPAAIERGVSFDASAIRGFSNVAESDLFLFPDLDTFSLLPWRPSEGCVGRFYCDVRYPDGTPFEGDARAHLRRLVQYAAKTGFTFQVGPESEFYLFRTGDDGQPMLAPHDRAGYFDISPVDRGENVRREICLALEEMGVQPERSHHEHGPGQNEIDFHCSSPLRAADDLMTLRTAVKAVSAQSGLFASFLPKPLKGESGSGLHINLSMYRDGRNVFESFRETPDPDASAFLAGILARMREITAVTNPLPGSYDRFGSCEAPRAVNWSFENRSTLIRVPAARGNDCRIEVRSPDPACNPYSTILLLISAGLDGVKHRLTLPAPLNSSAYDAPADGSTLPATLGEALESLRTSDFVRRVLPTRMLDSFLRVKDEEFARYEASGDKVKYEIEHYFRMV